jgi:glycosyltransferase involved in cell wall biosynthesis
MEKRVSIITPCFNGEKFVERYLESIINQTYTNIELIFVNDGSTDKTGEIVQSYISKFEQSNMKFVYVNQKNAGLAAAIQAGLKLFTGEYLIWPDSDDSLPLDSIEKRVNFLEKNKQYGLVRSDGYLFNEENLNKPIRVMSKKNPNRFKEDLFEDYIIEKGTWMGCFMIRTSAFLDVNPKREIYISRAGQNWQMLLPIMYKYKCGFIDEPLYNCVVRKDSLSHSDRNINLQTSLNKFSNYEDILRHVIDSMDIDKVYYNKLITEKYARRKMVLAIKYKDKGLLIHQYAVLRNVTRFNINDRITFIKGLIFLSLR